jgi:hypothetical protein
MITEDPARTTCPPVVSGGFAVSTIRLSCCAHQRPIGQGGFYSATITLPEIDSYTLVYDCGSLTNKDRLNAEIEQFDSELANRPLDLLVRSLSTSMGLILFHCNPFLSPIEVINHWI